MKKKLKAENPKDCVDRLLEMSEFFKDADPTLALKLRDTASRALDFVAYREYLAQRKRWRNQRRELLSNQSRNGERKACARA